MKNVCRPVKPKILEILYLSCQKHDACLCSPVSLSSALSVKWKFIQPLLPKRTLNVLLNVYYYDDVEDING